LSSGNIAATNLILDVNKVDVLNAGNVTCSGYVDSYTCSGGVNNIWKCGHIYITGSVIGSLKTRLVNISRTFTFSTTGRFEANIWAGQESSLYNNQPRTINVSGSGAILNLMGYWHWYNFNIVQTNGRVNMMGNIRVASISGVLYSIKQSGGILNLMGTINLVDRPFGQYSGIEKTGGEMIINGGTIIVGNDNQKAIIAPTTPQNINVYSSGFSTNKTNVLGIDQQERLFTITTASTGTSVTLNGVLFTATLGSKEFMADDLTNKINASVDVAIVGILTASQVTPLTDTFFTVQADVPGVEFSSTDLNITFATIVPHTELMTNTTSGVVLSNANITQ